MRKPLPVHVLSSAKAAIVEARNWWRAHREKAPFAFDEELERALELIARQPGVGAKAQSPNLRSVRRLHLGRIHYYLYYRVVETSNRVEVLAAWHTSRGSKPPA